MGLKKYIIATLIFIIVVFGYVYSLELGDFEASLLGYSLSLPASVWIIFPVLVIVFVTYLHIIFYAVLNYFRQRAVTKDHESMIEFIKSGLLEKTNTVKFRTKEFKNLSSILAQFDITPKAERFTSSDEDLNKIVGNIQDVRDGKYVNEKSFKVNENSKLANLNLLNKVNEQIDFAVDVLKKPENYLQNIVRQAFVNVLNEKSMTTIKKVYKNIECGLDGSEICSVEILKNNRGFYTINKREALLPINVSNNYALFGVLAFGIVGGVVGGLIDDSTAQKSKHMDIAKDKNQEFYIDSLTGNFIFDK